MNELYHHGIKGQKWGVRRDSTNSGSAKGKLHLGLDDHGNINLSRNKTTRVAKKKFAIKTSIFAAGIAASVYISKHPKLVIKGMDFVHKRAEDSAATESSYKVFSKSLGRYLTVKELIDEGLM